MTSVARSTRRWSAVVRVLLAGQVVLLAVFAVSTLTRSRDGYDVVLDGFLGNAVLALPAVVCFVRAATVRADRLLFVLLGTAPLLFTAGSLAYTLSVRFADPMPYPSWADAGWLATYLALFPAVALAARDDVGSLQGSVWLDGLLGGLGVATLAAALGLRTIIDDLEGGTLGTAVNVAYPVADLLLLTLVAGIVALSGGRPGRRWLWLGSGLVCYAVGDTLYLVRVATDTYVAGTPLDVAWACGLTLLTFPAAQAGPVARRSRPDGAAALAVPLAFSALAVAVLAVASRTPMPLYVVGLAVATLTVALVRTAVAFRLVRALAESRQQARTDDLTGLANRRAFYERLEVARPGAAAVLLLDLDRFKDINDSLGHHVGDELLRQLGERLVRQLPPEHLLARLGGDEFAVLVEQADHARAVSVAGQVRAALADPFVLDGVALHVGGSIGIALEPGPGGDDSLLLRRADVAMYEAKSRQVEWFVYDPDHDLHSLDRLRTIEQLRAALETDEVVLHYQPKCAVATGAVTGVEALVRWQHPERGLLYPDTFLPLVEQTGLMPLLTLTVLDQAVRQCRAWRDQALDLTVAVNLSVSNLLDDGLPRQVCALLEKHGVPASSLELEITENTLMVDPLRATATLRALKDLGVTLSVDDYGTGYCSLSYLQNLPIDELKLDRSFISSLGEGTRDVAIVRSTVDLAHALGLRMVAEGVETGEVLDLLQDLGCDLAQGYHLSRPLPPQALTPWLLDHEVHRPGGLRRSVAH